MLKQICNPYNVTRSDFILKRFLLRQVILLFGVNSHHDTKVYF